MVHRSRWLWLWPCVFAACAACAAGRGNGSVGHGRALPPLAAAGGASVGRHEQLAARLHLAQGQRALARGEYALAEEQFLRAVYVLPMDPEARLGLAEVWLMLGLAQRQESLLTRAHEAVSSVLALGQANGRAAELQRYIEEMLPPSR